ncbi:hypothetical protein RRF57_009054 [Xylaria bambusicola]|uniref:Uncharacterized protein n=1 Tax=Xylaria bambusicola TaxID=326684 RepID=A0AAN7UIY1_9PEZI
MFQEHLSINIIRREEDGIEKAISSLRDAMCPLNEGLLSRGQGGSSGNWDGWPIIKYLVQ